MTVTDIEKPDLKWSPQRITDALVYGAIDESEREHAIYIVAAALDKMPDEDMYEVVKQITPYTRTRLSDLLDNQK